MPRAHEAQHPESFTRFGELLRYLRQRARLTQRELSIAVGYSESHISRLEQGQRPPDSATLRARFLPPLDIDDPTLAERLIELGALARELPELTPPPSLPPGLLATKLFAPRHRHSMLPRPQLAARLDAALDLPLTVVAAPAGSGKTSLVADWYAGLDGRGGGRPPLARAWLSLDPGDNEPSTFARYLAAALQPVALPATALPEPGLPLGGPLAALLTPLVNALAGLGHDVVLVLDDYHVISASPIHAALTFLIEHAPPQLHLLLLTREDPPLPLARLRARRQLLELRAADLRFAPDEAATFLRDVMELAVSPQEARALWSATEGWVAGVQLAALALRDHTDRRQFLAAMSGTNRYVMDYLASEVLDQLPAHLRSFLLSTAILDRLCAPLCDRLLGTEDPGGGTYSQLLLEELERRHLFMVPLDPVRHWYRYHHLFAELLRARLRSGVDQHTLAQLNGRASRWFEEQGLVEEAIMHAAGAADWGRVAGLVERANQAFFDLASFQGWAGTTWLAMIPERVRRQQPHLCLVQSWALRDDDPAASEHWLDSAELAAESWEDGEAKRRIAGEIAAARTSGALLRGDSAAVLAVAHQTLPALGEEEARLRILIQWNLGRALFQEGRLSEAGQVLAEVIQQARAAGPSPTLVYSVAFYGYFQRACGRLGAAEATFRAGPRPALPSGVSSGAEGASLLIGLADLQRERNELALGLKTIAAALSLSGTGGLIRVGSFGALVRARLLAALGDAQAASDVLRERPADGDYEFLRMLAPLVRAFEAQLALQLGQLAEAEAWAATAHGQWHPLYANTPTLAVYADEHLRVAPIQVALARGRLRSERQAATEALGLADALADEARALGRPWLLAKGQALRALALALLGDHGGALDALAAALAVAQPAGYVRLFLDEGAPLAALLRAYQVERGTSAFLAALLTALPQGKR